MKTQKRYYLIEQLPYQRATSPSESMLERLTNLSLYMPVYVEIDYELFRENEYDRRHKIRQRWENKYRAALLPEPHSGQKVWVKDLYTEGAISRKHDNPDSYWVKVDLSVLRRNRRYLFTFGSGKVEIAGYDRPVHDSTDTNKGVESESNVIANG